MATLPKSGLQGTLQNIGTSKYLKGKVLAKSGSMSKVRGYAGYLFTEQQDTLAFAILWNQFLCPSKKINGQVEAFWTAWRE
jgi:D-alanyl-D-alanine carboxypeptidase/D-alanyl-D-alanine-endopeptidase (penicillin-binding protein 4)